MSEHRADRTVIVAAGLALVLLTGVSTIALGAARGAFDHRSSAPDGQCAAPRLSGTVVDVTLTDMAGPMVQRAGIGGLMRVLASSSRVQAGTVSLRVANTGSLVHELVVLPLPRGQHVGDRQVSADGRVTETGSVGEVSRTCAAGSGDGIDPGAIGWVTLRLPPGTYELVCNLVGHYAAGMYTQLTVT